VQLVLAEVSARAAAGRWRGCEPESWALVAAPALVPAATVIRVLAARLSVSDAHLIGNWVQLGLAQFSARAAAGRWRGCEPGSWALVVAPALVPAATISGCLRRGNACRLRMIQRIGCNWG
jgi:hypothetical protein